MTVSGLVKDDKLNYYKVVEWDATATDWKICDAYANATGDNALTTEEKASILAGTLTGTIAGKLAKIKANKVNTDAVTVAEGGT